MFDFCYTLGSHWNWLEKTLYSWLRSHWRKNRRNRESLWNESSGSLSLLSSDTETVRSVGLKISEESDFLSLHCPLNESNHHTYNRESLVRMKESSVLTNTARGPLIDEWALADTLNREGDFRRLSRSLPSNLLRRIIHSYKKLSDHSQHTCILEPPSLNENCLREPCFVSPAGTPKNQDRTLLFDKSTHISLSYLGHKVGFPPRQNELAYPNREFVGDGLETNWTGFGQKQFVDSKESLLSSAKAKFPAGKGSELHTTFSKFRFQTTQHRSPFPDAHGSHGVSSSLMSHNDNHSCSQLFQSLYCG